MPLKRIRTTPLNRHPGHPLLVLLTLSVYADQWLRYPVESSLPWVWAPTPAELMGNLSPARKVLCRECRLALLETAPPVLN